MSVARARIYNGLRVRARICRTHISLHQHLSIHDEIRRTAKNVTKRDEIRIITILERIIKNNNINNNNNKVVLWTAPRGQKWSTVHKYFITKTSVHISTQLSVFQT